MNVMGRDMFLEVPSFSKHDRLAELRSLSAALVDNLC